jgi:hypothetical protein
MPELMKVIPDPLYETAAALRPGVWPIDGQLAASQHERDGRSRALLDVRAKVYEKSLHPTPVNRSIEPPDLPQRRRVPGHGTNVQYCVTSFKRRLDSSWLRPIRSMMVPSLLLSVVACDAALGERGTAPLVRDSAGITIVENTAPAWTAAEAWRISPEPVLRIGTMAGAPAYQLYQVAGATRLPDGRIVVANAGTAELRFYAADGRHLASAGGRGGGPGEFQMLAGVEHAGDAVVAFDRTARRFSEFTLDGAFVASHSAGGGSAAPFFLPAGRFADGTVAFGGIEMGMSGGPGGVTRGRARTDVLYLRLAPSGEVLDTVGRFPGPERVTRVQESGGQSRVTMMQVRFSATPQLRAAGDGFVYSATDRYELAFHGGAGELERLVRRPHDPEPVMEEHLRQADQQMRQQAQATGGGATGGGGGGVVGPPSPTAVAALQETPHAEFFPALGMLLVDPGGNVWVSPYPRPGAEGPVAWDVFDGEGTWLGSVEIPSELRVFEIGEDYVLGLWRDDLDVEYLHLHELIRP